ncbi:ATP-grasp domain-containing protein [Methylomonas koyamae]|uniref:Alpha-L-glutamate ligase n=1 Tax=Methylomonas koyamae TaxID=702114 RepID=A0A291III3_9GAMM|nr:RimK family alpha-L-glutamate ligase [Methylomonas koyamae]ATG90016.1 alpha-L-glutamate ligase [Methylomonas koyamae]OAI24480.1 alpha-L-glutamate ligase [Methylomonas koyamae]
MRRIVIFTDDPGWHGKQLCLAFAARGFTAEYASLTGCRLQLDNYDLPVLVPGFEDRLPAAAFVRGVPGGSLEEVVFYLDVLHALKLLGVPVYNDAGAIERSVDKGMTSFLLQRAGLPTAATWVLRDREQALAIAERELQQGNYLISKPLFGSQGEGIRRIEKSTDLLWLTGCRGIYYLQRFIECDGDGYSDVRVFVVNGKAVAAMRRRGISWLNNVARGASCEAIAMEAELVELAVAAADALRMDYAGVDLIKDRHGNYRIIEVNSVPAWKGLQGVCQANVAQWLVADLLQRYLGELC